MPGTGVESARGGKESQDGAQNVDTGTTSGDCPECGEPLFWMGMSWAQHTQERHDGARRRLLRTVRLQMGYEKGLRLWRAENAAQDLVGIRWRNGVYPGWQTESRSAVPGDVWDVMDQAYLLRMMREGLTALFEDRYGVKINQATWFHKIYDDRPQGEPCTAMS